MGEPVDEAAAWRPSSALRPFVAGYVGWRQDGAAPRVHRGLPSRHLTLVLGLDGPVEVIGPAGERHRYGALVGGLHDAPVGIPQPRRHEGIQVSVTPAGARALLGVPAAAVASAVVDLGDLLGPRADELLERLAAAGGWSARFRLLDGVLAELIGRGAGRGAEVPAEVGEAWRRLVATGGGVAVGDLAHDLGWSRRHLGERFRREVGLAPKVAARVLRFEAACREIRRPDRPSLADVAATCGYADQSHLVREWHAFAGCAPTTWMAEELPSVQDAAAPVGAG